MESTDEKVAQKARMLKEAEMKDHAKIQGREIAKKRIEAGYKRNEMEAISSADFEHNQEEKPAEALAHHKSPNKYDDILAGVAENPTKTFASDKPQVSSF